jgi:hypothetical protein
MSIPNFSLTRKVPIVFTRQSQGDYNDKGVWVDGTDEVFTAQCNIQPSNYSKIQSMPESDRTEEWQTIYTSTPLRKKKEGIAGYAGDRFEWLGDTYEIRKTKRYTMGILDHTEAMAVRIELTQE